MITRRSSVLGSMLCAFALTGCGSDGDDAKPSKFELKFAAVVDGHQVGCSDALPGFGPEASDTIGLNDLRFYVSGLRFGDAAGHPVAVALDADEFQLASTDGSVALIDLTDNSSGSCGPNSVAYAEGTARTHVALTGTTLVHRVTSVAFDIGVPQALMKKTIASNTPEGAPSPLNEMYWNWNSGYRHLVANFAVQDAKGGAGAGYVHVGSRDCAPMGDGIKALEDRASCTFVNTPQVTLSGFDLDANSVGLDLREMLAGIDFVSPIYDPSTFEVIGTGPGVECHSSPMQPDCPPIFNQLGLDLETGTATPATNRAFVRLPVP